MLGLVVALVTLLKLALQLKVALLTASMVLIRPALIVRMCNDCRYAENLTSEVQELVLASHGLVTEGMEGPSGPNTTTPIAGICKMNNCNDLTHS